MLYHLFKVMLDMESSDYLCPVPFAATPHPTLSFPLLRGNCCQGRNVPSVAGKRETVWGQQIIVKNGDVFPYFLYFCPFPQHIFKFGNFVNIGTDCSKPFH